MFTKTRAMQAESWTVCAAVKKWKYDLRCCLPPLRVEVGVANGRMVGLRHDKSPVTLTA
jgi:hypothetical protein